MNSLIELQKNYVPVEVPKLSAEEVQWFRDDKFGMFIHWGLYSILGKGEWVMFKERMDIREYELLANRFVGESFDAKTWASVAKNAGMKYMVFTARHHDGFCLYDSKVSSYNSVNAAAKKDFVGEYVEACRNEGLKVGIYYSPMDWRFPGYFFPEMYFDSAMDMKNQCWDQIRELMTNYGKIDMLWFDGEWLAHGGIGFNDEVGWHRDSDWMNSFYMKTNYFWESEKLIAMIRELQPGIMINNRIAWEGDFTDRERCTGGMKTDKPWDSDDCLTVSWGWISDSPMLSLRESIKKLVNIVVRDGVFLLNIGPTPEGEIEERQMNRLAQIGEWLEKYGESIYKTRGGPFLPGLWGGSTYRERTIYVHINEWTEDIIVLPALDNHIVSYGSLTSKLFTVEQAEEGIKIFVPINERHPMDTIITLEMESPIQWDGSFEEEASVYGLGDGLHLKDKSV